MAPSLKSTIQSVNALKGALLKEYEKAKKAIAAAAAAAASSTRDANDNDNYNDNDNNDNDNDNKNKNNDDSNTGNDNDNNDKLFDAEMCLDMLKRLDEIQMSLPVLTETLIGTAVSKFKNLHVSSPSDGGQQLLLASSIEDVSTSAKKLVKKWKKLAKEGGAVVANANVGVGAGAGEGGGGSTPTSISRRKSDSKKMQAAAAAAAASASKKAMKKKSPNNINAAAAANIITRPSPSLTRATSSSTSSSSTSCPPPPEWSDLEPPYRKNVRVKLLELLSLSQKETNKSRDDVITLSSSIEDAIYNHARVRGGKDDKSVYTTKARQLNFNLKKNSELRCNLLNSEISPSHLISMSSEELATSEQKKAKNELAKNLQDSRRLDWEQANETKINEMCGIKGDLLKASLFTCGRCKSTKTTSTQKQTRSADEPMTVFVFCTNCGNRWKC